MAVGAPEPAGAPAHSGQARQQSLFTGAETPKVIQFPAPARPRHGAIDLRTRPRRPVPRDDQPSLDFSLPAPHAPRTLKTSVEAVIYCDAPVATPLHRALACALDFSVIAVAAGLFLLTFYLCGGELEISRPTLPWFGAAFLFLALFYGFLWALAGSETAGMRILGLRLINFDGFPPDRRERWFRYLGACLSFCSGLGVVWSLADEESLTWHDHMSKTFPTPRG